MVISQQIRFFRRQKKMTQSQLAAALGINGLGGKVHISNLEAGRTQPSLALLYRIAKILECRFIIQSISD